MKHLDHANVLKVYEVFETKHSIYLVIELLEGGELIKRIKEKNKLSYKDIAKLMKCLLSALDHIHSKGIMHRDLKPENILLRKKLLKSNYPLLKSSLRGAEPLGSWLLRSFPIRRIKRRFMMRNATFSVQE
jgi:serine/threonine protein kinase